jgi:uncharacterized membrane protein
MKEDETMANCVKCGTPLTDGVRFCTSCGAEQVVHDTEQTPPAGQGTGSVQENLEKTWEKINHTADTTDAYDKTDVEQNKMMAVLAYIGILVLVPIFAVPNSKFARYHANQGLILFVAEVAYGIAYSILAAILTAISWVLGLFVSLLGLVGLVFLVLAVMGIMNAINGKAKELPIIGKYTILK